MDETCSTRQWKKFQTKNIGGRIYLGKGSFFFLRRKGLSQVKKLKHFSHIISLCSYIGHDFCASVHLHRMFPLLLTFFTIFSIQLIKVFTELHPCFFPRQIFSLLQCPCIPFTLENYSHHLFNYSKIFSNVFV